MTTMQCVNRCKPMEVNKQKMRNGESLPGTSSDSETAKLAIAVLFYLTDIKNLNLESKNTFCHIIVDRLYTDAIFLPENIPSPW